MAWGPPFLSLDQQQEAPLLPPVEEGVAVGGASTYSSSHSVVAWVGGYVKVLYSHSFTLHTQSSVVGGIWGVLRLVELDVNTNPMEMQEAVHLSQRYCFKLLAYTGLV